MFLRVLGFGGRGGCWERDLVVSIVGIMTWGYYLCKWIIVSFLCTYIKVGFYSHAKDTLLLVSFRNCNVYLPHIENCVY